ncbi:MAG TPA: hypothetical protein VFU21_10795 [Kofleriaceae bacterium]|nr:hypothetical protein [Kofleriaceae bacterium]
MRQGDDLSPSSTHLNPPGLEREVEPARPWLRRGRTQLAIVTACLAVIAASGLVVWVRVARFWFAAAPAPVATAGPVLAAELPAADGEVATATLAADDPIGPSVTADIPPDPEGWRGAAASPDRFGVVALWSDRTLWVSRDDGRSFHQELAAPEPLGAVAVGADARVYAARHGGRFGVLTPAGHTRWQRLDFDQALALAHGGPWTVLLAMSADRQIGLVPILWATADHGDTWRRLVAPAAGDLDNRVRVGPDGSIDLLVRATGDLAPVSRLYRGHVDGRPFAPVQDSEDPQPFGLGHDGSVARVVWTGGDARLEPYHLALSDWDVVVGAGPTRTLAVADRRLLALNGTRADTLSDRVPGRPAGLTSDGIGRSLAIIGRVAVRHSEAHGWRRLFELPAVDPPAR